MRRIIALVFAKYLNSLCNVRRLENHGVVAQMSQGSHRAIAAAIVLPPGGDPGRGALAIKGLAFSASWCKLPPPLLLRMCAERTPSWNLIAS